MADGVVADEADSSEDVPVAGGADDRSSAARPDPARVAGWIAIAVPFVVQAVAVLTGSRAWLVHRLPDDAFYYLEIARRLGRGEGVTVDGINPTTGVHPLWTAVLVPLTRLFGDDALVRATLLLSLALLAIALVLAVRLVQRATGPGPALAAGVVAAWSMALVRVTASGLEGPVVVLALVLVALALERWDRRPTPLAAVGVGAVVAVAVLARLDLVLVLGVVPLAVWRRGSLVEAARVVGGAALVGVPAAAWFVLATGHLGTTSALVKSVWMDRLARRYGGRFTLGHLRFLVDTGRDYVVDVGRGLSGPALSSPVPDVAAVVPVGVAVGGAAVAARERRGRGGRWGSAAWALGVVGGVVALKAVVDVVASPLWASAWYSAPVRLAGAMAVGGFGWVGLRALGRRSVPLAVAVAVAVGLVALPLDLGPLLSASSVEPAADLWQDQIDAAAAQLRAAPPGGRIGALDSGLLGFALDPVPVVNLDGLVNSYDYVELVRQERPLRDLIAAEGVDVLVNRLTDDQVAELGCGVERWRSSGEVRDAAPDGTVVSAPVRILDVRACRPA